MSKIVVILLAIFVCSDAYGQSHPGLENIITKAYSPTIMDPVIFANLWRSWDTASRDAAEKASRKGRRKITLERYGLLEAPYDNGGAPLGIVVKKDGSYAVNCLICHAGAVAGQTILGVPNSALDFSSFYEDIGKTITLLHGDEPGNPPFPEGLVNMARLITNTSGKELANVHFPEGILGVSRGTTNIFAFAVQLLSYRDRELNVLETPLQLRPLGHYIDPPPWWHVANKKDFFMDAFTEKSARALMQFSLDPSIEPNLLKSWEDDYKEIYAWLHTIESPKYKGVIESEMAADGKQIYLDSCANCHGTPGIGGEYTTKIVAIEEVRTDRSRLDGLSDEFKEHYSKSWLGYYGETKIRIRSKGYVAQPLDGIWATAPYFHNGSVPTLYHVLFPDERPTVWKVKDYRSYDHKRAGLSVEEHMLMPETFTLAEKRAYFDTNQKTMSNGGHPFADKLSKEQKLSLLEYLKSL